ncbi:hypothetical protein BDP27DRAFT_1368609 [Rhodocollybia butyracea]|uniref:Uncharacterized protein n=1 Tax=Rhodocollybia butyracea TaxID=206335 RepID=A0A9P5PG64_9AGAR|nr:hypothetical protein BDP27DRAFT_1368609 [Rhodocollybia butyracea]
MYHQVQFHQVIITLVRFATIFGLQELQSESGSVETIIKWCLEYQCKTTLDTLSFPSGPLEQAAVISEEAGVKCMPIGANGMNTVPHECWAAAPKNPTNIKKSWIKRTEGRYARVFERNIFEESGLQAVLTVADVFGLEANMILFRICISQYHAG